MTVNKHNPHKLLCQLQCTHLLVAGMENSWLGGKAPWFQVYVGLEFPLNGLSLSAFVVEFDLLLVFNIFSRSDLCKRTMVLEVE